MRTDGTNVTSIGDGAFEECRRLAIVNIPGSVTNIGEEAFVGCYNLKAITVGTNNPDYSSVGGVLFDRGQDTLIEYPPGNTNSSYTIPDSVSSIGDFAFYGTSLTSVTNNNLTITNWSNYAGTIINNTVTNSPPKGNLYFRLVYP